MVMQILDAASTVDASRPSPLGVSVRRAGLAGEDHGSGHGVNVAVFAPEVSRLEVVFQAPGEPWKVRPLPTVTSGVHHGIVESMPPGTRYGFRPAAEEDALPLAVPSTELMDDDGQQLLLDPYGRAVDQRGDFITSWRMD